MVVVRDKCCERLGYLHIYTGIKKPAVHAQRAFFMSQNLNKENNEVISMNRETEKMRNKKRLLNMHTAKTL